MLQSAGAKVAGFMQLRKFFEKFNHTHAFFMEPREQCFYDNAKHGSCKGNGTAEPAGAATRDDDVGSSSSSSGRSDGCCNQNREPSLTEERQQCSIMAEFAVHFGMCKWLHVSTWAGLWAPHANRTAVEWAESKRQQRSSNRHGNDGDRHNKRQRQHQHQHQRRRSRRNNGQEFSEGVALRKVVNEECPSWAPLRAEKPREFQTLPRLLAHPPCSNVAAGAGREADVSSEGAGDGGKQCGKRFAAAQCSPGAVTTVALDMWSALFGTGENPDARCDTTMSSGEARSNMQPTKQGQGNEKVKVALAKSRPWNPHRRPPPAPPPPALNEGLPSPSTMFWAFVRGFFGVPKSIPHNLLLEGAGNIVPGDEVWKDGRWEFSMDG